MNVVCTLKISGLGTMYALVFIVLLLGTQLCSGCESGERRKGCRIQNKRCSCDDFGCNSDYRYETYEECEKALRGKRSDRCNPNPCLRGGNCLQISQHPGFKCRCDGTGYFGNRCNRVCPIPGAGSIGVYPYECIVI